MRQDIRFCTTPDNVQLAYAVCGEGPPVVMSATWLSHLEHQWRSLAWRPWLDAFTRKHKVLRHDSRGCGLSDRNASNLSFETWMRDLECVIEAAGFGRFAMVGTCWGGPIAIEYAARHPERVSHLVLYGTYARGTQRRGDFPHDAERMRVMRDITRLGWANEDHAFLQIWSSRFQPGGGREHRRSWCEQMRAATSPDTAIRLFEIAGNIDVQDAARKVRCPALIVHPERDVNVPIGEGRLLAGLIPHCRFMQLDTDNHMLLADEPAWGQLVSKVRSFLAEPGYSPAARRTGLPLEELTPRERAVLEGVAKGLDNSEIAAMLRLSEKTVRNHISRIFDKIDVKHRYQLIVLAREAGLGGTFGSSVQPETGHLSRVLSAPPKARRDIGLKTSAFSRARMPTEGATRTPAGKPR
jgi:pimeloyl-ACP methyl ester carboxylesterase/DNA-binding CsgD family transcriptional regulator